MATIPPPQPPDPATEALIERTIRVYLEEEGCADVTAGVQEVKAQIDRVRMASHALGEAVNDLNGKMRSAAKAHVSGEKAASQALKEHRLSLAKTIGSYANLGGAVTGAFSEIGNGIRDLTGLGGFGKMVKEAVAYDKALLQLSAATNRLGIGLTQLEAKMTSIGSATQLTRQEAMGLFSEFNKNYKFVSFRDFESLLGRIKGMVGSNKDAIQEYMSSVSGLSQNYAGLAQKIAKIGKGGTFEDKEAVSNRVKMLYLSRKIGDVEYRNLMAVIRGNQQISSTDKKRQEQAQDRIETIQKFRRHIETVGLKIGQSILPFLEKVANFLEDITESGDKWYRAVAMGVGLLAGAQLGGGLLKAGATSLISGGGSAAAGAAGVAGGGVAGAAGRIGGFGLRLAGGAAMAYGGHKLGESMREKGKQIGGTKGYFYEAGGNLARVGGAGAAGATIGSQFGATGAAAGFAIGSVAGLGKLMWDEFSGEAEKEQIRKKLADRASRTKVEEVTARAEKEFETSKAISKASEEGRERGRSVTDAKGQADIMADYRKQQEILKQREMKEYGVSSTKDLRAEKDRRSKQIEEAEQAVAKEESIKITLKTEIEEAKKEKKKDVEAGLKRQLEYQEKKIEEAEEAAKSLRDAQDEITQRTRGTNVELARATAAYDAMIEKQRELSVFADKAGELVGVESSRLDTVIKKMQMTGNIDIGQADVLQERVFGAIESETKSLVAARDALSQQMQEQQTQAASALDMDMGELKATIQVGGFSDEQKKILEDINISSTELIDGMITMGKTEEEILKKTEKRQRVVEALNNLYQTQIAYAGAVAEEASLLVQIADSYAMGVGASAQMRMREYDALEKQRESMELQLQKSRELLAAQTTEDGRLEQAKRVQEQENAILQVQLKQAGITRSLRDGWIEAIGAMNTGAGTFSKIVLDQNKGTAQALKLAGQSAVVSSRSGSLKGGYRTSEKFSAMQGVAGQGLISGSIGKRTEAYRTTMDEMTGSSAEGLQWRARGQMSRKIAKQNRIATSRGLAGTAFGASQHYEGVVGEFGTGRGYGAPDYTDGTTNEFDTSTDVTRDKKENRKKMGIARIDEESRMAEGFTGDRQGSDITLSYTNGAVDVFVTNMGEGVPSPAKLSSDRDIPPTADTISVSKSIQKIENSLLALAKHRESIEKKMSITTDNDASESLKNELAVVDKQISHSQSMLAKVKDLRDEKIVAAEVTSPMPKSKDAPEQITEKEKQTINKEASNAEEDKKRIEKDVPVAKTKEPQVSEAEERQKIQGELVAKKTRQTELIEEEKVIRGDIKEKSQKLEKLEKAAVVEKEIPRWVETASEDELSEKIKEGKTTQKKREIASVAATGDILKNFRVTPTTTTGGGYGYAGYYGAPADIDSRTRLTEENSSPELVNLVTQLEKKQIELERSTSQFVKHTRERGEQERISTDENVSSKNRAKATKRMQAADVDREASRKTSKKLQAEISALEGSIRQEGQRIQSEMSPVPTEAEMVLNVVGQGRGGSGEGTVEGQVAKVREELLQLNSKFNQNKNERSQTATQISDLQSQLEPKQLEPKQLEPKQLEPKQSPPSIVSQIASPMGPMGVVAAKAVSEPAKSLYKKVTGTSSSLLGKAREMGATLPVEERASEELPPAIAEGERVIGETPTAETPTTETPKDNRLAEFRKQKDKRDKYRQERFQAWRKGYQERKQKRDKKVQEFWDRRRSLKSGETTPEAPVKTNDPILLSQEPDSTTSSTTKTPDVVKDTVGRVEPVIETGEVTPNVPVTATPTLTKTPDVVKDTVGRVEPVIETGKVTPNVPVPATPTLTKTPDVVKDTVGRVEPVIETAETTPNVPVTATPTLTKAPDVVKDTAGRVEPVIETEKVTPNVPVTADPTLTKTPDIVTDTVGRVEPVIETGKVTPNAPATVVPTLTKTPDVAKDAVGRVEPVIETGKVTPNVPVTAGPTLTKTPDIVTDAVGRVEPVIETGKVTPNVPVTADPTLTKTPDIVKDTIGRVEPVIETGKATLNVPAAADPNLTKTPDVAKDTVGLVEPVVKTEDVDEEPPTAVQSFRRSRLKEKMESRPDYAWSKKEFTDAGLQAPKNTEDAKRILEKSEEDEEIRKEKQSRISRRIMQTPEQKSNLLELKKNMESIPDYAWSKDEFSQAGLRAPKNTEDAKGILAEAESVYLDSSQPLEKTKKKIAEPSIAKKTPSVTEPGTTSTENTTKAVGDVVAGASQAETSTTEKAALIEPSLKTPDAAILGRDARTEMTSQERLSRQLRLENTARIMDTRSGKQISAEDEGVERRAYETRKKGPEAAAKKILNIQDKIRSRRATGDESQENLTVINRLKKELDALGPENYQAEIGAIKDERAVKESAREAYSRGEFPQKPPSSIHARDPLASSAAAAPPTMDNGTLGTINVNVKLQSNAQQVSQEIADKIGDEVASIINTSTVKFADSVSLK